MTAQIQRLNLKWSVADVDAVAAMTAKGRSATEIAESLRGTTLESSPSEIVNLMHDMGVYVPLSRKRYGR